MHPDIQAAIQARPAHRAPQDDAWHATQATLRRCEASAALRRMPRMYTAELGPATLHVSAGSRTEARHTMLMLCDTYAPALLQDVLNCDVHLA